MVESNFIVRVIEKSQGTDINTNKNLPNCKLALYSGEAP